MVEVRTFGKINKKGVRGQGLGIPTQRLRSHLVELMVGSAHPTGSLPCSLYGVAVKFLKLRGPV